MYRDFYPRSTGSRRSRYARRIVGEPQPRRIQQPRSLQQHREYEPRVQAPRQQRRDPLRPDIPLTLRQQDRQMAPRPRIRRDYDDILPRRQMRRPLDQQRRAEGDYDYRRIPSDLYRPELRQQRRQKFRQPSVGRGHYLGRGYAPRGMGYDQPHHHQQVRRQPRTVEPLDYAQDYAQPAVGTWRGRVGAPMIDDAPMGSYAMVPASTIGRRRGAGVRMVRDYPLSEQLRAAREEADFYEEMDYDKPKRKRKSSAKKSNKKKASKSSKKKTKKKTTKKRKSSKKSTTPKKSSAGRKKSSAGRKKSSAGRKKSSAGRKKTAPKKQSVRKSSRKKSRRRR